MRVPVYRLPPFKVQSVIMALSETVDWGLKAYGIPDLWKDARGAGVKVAVLDTGCDLDHVDLKANIADARDFSGSRYGAEDVVGHGTHVAGTIAACQNNAGVVGICPDLKKDGGGLYIGKVLGDKGTGSSLNVAAGIRYAVEKWAVDVISMSLGSPMEDPAIKAEIANARRRGVHVVAAAGNDYGNPIDYPGSDENVVCVGAVGVDGKLAAFSDKGPQLDVCAPGEDIVSTYLNGGYAKLAGTSMATPFVSGTIALMLSKHRKLHGRGTYLSPETVLTTIQQTAKDAGEPGFDTAYGWGLINPASVLEHVAEVPAPAPSPIVPVPGEDLKLGPARVRWAEFDGHRWLCVRFE